MADEGIGIDLVERLAREAGRYPTVEFIDAGTGGMSVLHRIEGRRKAILIDCAYMGEAPGTLRRFTPDEVRSTKVLAHQSLHEADLLRVLTLAEQLGQAPGQVVIFGIQPQVVEVRQGLSGVLLRRVEHYLAEIRSELERSAGWPAMDEGDEMGQGRILIIDDDPDITEAMAVVLVNLDFTADREAGFELNPATASVRVRLPRFFRAAGVVEPRFPEQAVQVPAEISTSLVEFSTQVQAGKILVIYSDESLLQQMRSTHARCLEQFVPSPEPE